MKLVGSFKNNTIIQNHINKIYNSINNNKNISSRLFCTTTTTTTTTNDIVSIGIMKRNLNNNNNNNDNHHEDENEDDNNKFGHHVCDSHNEPPLKKQTTTTTTTTTPKQTSITDFFSNKPTTTTTTTTKNTKLKSNDTTSPFFSNNNNNDKNKKEEIISPFFSKITTTDNSSSIKKSKKKQEEEDENNEDDENEDDEDEDEEEEEKVKKSSSSKSKPIVNNKKKTSSKKKVNLTENKFSTLNHKDNDYVQNEEYKSSKLEKLENVKIGAHVSIKSGYPSIIPNVVAMGFKAVAFFTNPPRAWRQIAVKDECAKQFKKACKDYNFDTNCILPHGSYFLNLGSPNAVNLQKSRDLMIHEMNNCSKLGISNFNFHPGSHLNEISESESIKIIAQSLDIVLEATQGVTAVIECTAGQGSNLGYTFEHLRDIIALVKDKSRVGVCIDTCHLFAAGYNINSQKNCEIIFQEFDRVVGFKYLRGIHLNDSKAVCGSRLDRHENIGKGHIGEPVFKFLVNDKRFQNIPMILETPCPEETTYQKEVKLLYSFIKDDDNSDNKK